MLFSSWSGWQREISNQIFCSVTYKCLLWILSLPLLGHTLFISANSHVSLYLRNTLVGGKKGSGCTRRLFGKANFHLPVPLSWQKAIGVEGWQAHQNKNQRLEAMLFKESHHDQKSNRNTRRCLLSTVRGRKKMKARGSNVWKASLSLADFSRNTSQQQQLRETERQPRPT